MPKKNRNNLVTNEVIFGFLFLLISGWIYLQNQNFIFNSASVIFGFAFVLGTIFIFDYLLKIKVGVPNHRFQSTLEYLITYAWALVIILIVALLFFSFGVFNLNPTPQNTVTGFSGLQITQTCINGNIFLSLHNPSSYAIKINSINSTGYSGSNSEQFFVSINSGQTSTLMLSNSCPTSGSSGYSDSLSITYTEPYYIFPGPYISSGKITGSPASVSSYSGAYAASFNGINSYINISSIPLHNGSFTIVAFVSGKAFVEDAKSLENVIMSQAASSCPAFYHCIRASVRNDSLIFGIIGSDKPGTLNLSDNTWYMVTFIYNASSSLKSIYQNSSFDGSGKSNKPYSVSNGQTMIGAFWNGSLIFDNFNGIMANFQVYNTALTQSQITAIYNRGIEGVPIQTQNLLAWWTLDGNAIDYSGNHYDGLPINITFIPIS